jgi:hypothetical protein
VSSSERSSSLALCLGLVCSATASPLYALGPPRRRKTFVAVWLLTMLSVLTCGHRLGVKPPRRCSLSSLSSSCASARHAIRLIPLTSARQGISQCLIIARVGLARFVGATSIRVPMRPSAVEMTARGQQQLHCITDVNTALSIKFAHAATEDVDVEHASASSMT